MLKRITLGVLLTLLSWIIQLGMMQARGAGSMQTGILQTGTAQAAQISEQDHTAVQADIQADEDPSLDLTPPDIRDTFSSQQIDAALGPAADPNLEYVEVEALPLGDLPLRDRSATAMQTLISAALWLIAPSPAFTSRVNAAPDATHTLRPPPFLQSQHHPSFSRPESQR